MDNYLAEQEAHLVELDRILFPEGRHPDEEVRRQDRLDRLRTWRKLADASMKAASTAAGFEIRVQTIPFENRDRVAVYLRRRFGFSMPDSQRAVNTPGATLQKGLLQSEVDELRPDLETLGVTYEVLEG